MFQLFLCFRFYHFFFVNKIDKNFLLKPEALALMEAASFCAGVRHKRYSVQQETAPYNNEY
jgi:hypothetical protein